MNLEEQKALSLFRQYVSHYNSQDGQVHLKIYHTFQVQKLARQIAIALHLSEEDVELASIIGLFHDIGRFEQIRRYHDFRDNLTVDHAHLGVEELQKGLLAQCVYSRKLQDIVLAAVEQHNKYKIDPAVKDERALLHCRIIRDADKMDIFRVRACDTLENLAYFSQQELEDSDVSEDILNTCLQHKTILRTEVKTPADSWIAGAALVFDINFKESLHILKQTGYVEGMLHRFTFHKEKTREAFEVIEKELLEYMQ